MTVKPPPPLSRFIIIDSIVKQKGLLNINQNDASVTLQKSYEFFEKPHNMQNSQLFVHCQIKYFFSTAVINEMVIEWTS